MSGQARLVVFSVDGNRYSIGLDAVERAVRAAEVTPLPGAPRVVIGLLDVAGDILPVISLRRRAGLADRAICPDDEFLLVRTGRRRIVLVVDSILGVIERDADEVVAACSVVPVSGCIGGMVKLGDGIALVHDLDRFLSIEEEHALEGAMKEGAADAR